MLKEKNVLNNVNMVKFIGTITCPVQKQTEQKHKTQQDVTAI